MIILDLTKSKLNLCVKNLKTNANEKKILLYQKKVLLGLTTSLKYQIRDRNFN